MIIARPISLDAGNAPLYIRLAQTLRRKILDDNMAAGDALPSERDLCTILGASRVTVRKAIELLIEDGMLTRRHGSGTFVSQRIEAPGSYLSSFSEDAQSRGESSESIWITKIVGPATEEEARPLEIEVGARVARLSRVRLSTGEPLAVENAVIPVEMLGNVEEIADSLYQALDRRGNRPVVGTQRIRAALAGPTEASLLSIAPGAELLRIERLTRRADGRPVELTRSAYRGDRYDFVSELRGSILAP